MIQTQLFSTIVMINCYGVCAFFLGATRFLFGIIGSVAFQLIPRTCSRKLTQKKSCWVLFQCPKLCFCFFSTVLMPKRHRVSTFFLDLERFLFRYYWLNRLAINSKNMLRRVYAKKILVRCYLDDLGSLFFLRRFEKLSWGLRFLSRC